MTAAIAAWVRTLVALALVGNVVDWVLPAGGLRRYAGLVVGLVLLGAMVGPVWTLFSGIRKAGLEYPGSLRSAAMTASLNREQDADVAMVLGSLPGVERAAVGRTAGVVTVTLTVSSPPRSLRRAALDTVEELTGLGVRSIRVVELQTHSVRPRRAGHTGRG